VFGGLVEVREEGMTTQWTRRAAFGIGACLGMALLPVNTSSAAEPIRILVVMPGGSIELARQVRLFEDALRRSRGPVARAASLADADAVVEFTAYRRVISEGKPQDWWYGRYILLQAPAAEATTAGAKRFVFVVGDREDWQVEPVLNMLGTTLGGALGLAPASLPTGSAEDERRRTSTIILQE
jgi:hypothetical protein